jgi:hypothetical protein
MSLWWAVPAAIVLVLMLVVLFIGPKPEAKGGTSYDAGPRGFRAAYLVLEELGYPVARAKRPGGADVRLVLFPRPSEKDAGSLGDWVRRGGRLVLGTDSSEFAHSLGLELKIHTVPANRDTEPASGAEFSTVGGGAFRAEGPSGGRVWAEVGDRPLVTIYRQGQGEIWLLNRAEFLTNRLLGKADNGVLLCRLAEAVLAERPGRLAFDEVVHGMRERPSALELLFEPPALAVTLSGLLLLGILLWHYAPRFGTVRPLPKVRRRSKEEFLDALASLLERRADYADAFRTARDALRHELERELGLPADTAAELVAREAARRRPVHPETLTRLLQADVLPAGTGPGAFVQALHDLETEREQFFHERPHR